MERSGGLMKFLIVMYDRCSMGGMGDNYSNPGKCGEGGLWSLQPSNSGYLSFRPHGWGAFMCCRKTALLWMISENF